MSWPDRIPGLTLGGGSVPSSGSGDAPLDVNNNINKQDHSLHATAMELDPTATSSAEYAPNSIGQAALSSVAMRSDATSAPNVDQPPDTVSQAAQSSVTTHSDATNAPDLAQAPHAAGEEAQSSVATHSDTTIVSNVAQAPDATGQAALLAGGVAVSQPRLKRGAEHMDNRSMGDFENSKDGPSSQTSSESAVSENPDDAGAEWTFDRAQGQDSMSTDSDSDSDSDSESDFDSESESSTAGASSRLPSPIPVMAAPSHQDDALGPAMRSGTEPPLDSESDSDFDSIYGGPHGNPASHLGPRQPGPAASRGNWRDQALKRLNHERDMERRTRVGPEMDLLADPNFGKKIGPIPPDAELHELGTIRHAMSSYHIIVINGAPRSIHDDAVVDYGTWVVTEDRRPVGQVEEVFGPILSPFYTIAFRRWADFRALNLPVADTNKGSPCFLCGRWCDAEPDNGNGDAGATTQDGQIEADADHRNQLGRAPSDPQRHEQVKLYYVVPTAKFAFISRLMTQRKLDFGKKDPDDPDDADPDWFSDDEEEQRYKRERRAPKNPRQMSSFSSQTPNLGLPPRPPRPSGSDPARASQGDRNVRGRPPRRGRAGHGRGGFAPRGGFDGSVRGGYAPRGGFDGARGGYAPRGEFDGGARGGYASRGGFDGARGGYAPHGGFDGARGGFAPHDAFNLGRGGFASRDGFDRRRAGPRGGRHGDWMPGPPPPGPNPSSGPGAPWDSMYPFF